jgi:hypothetical protein
MVIGDWSFRPRVMIVSAHYPPCASVTIVPERLVTYNTRLDLDESRPIAFPSAKHWAVCDEKHDKNETQAESEAAYHGPGDSVPRTSGRSGRTQPAVPRVRAAQGHFAFA